MTNDLGLCESVTQDVSDFLESFSETDPAGKQAMAQLLAANPGKFVAAVLRLLPTREPTPGSRYLAQMLAKEKLLPAALLDTKAFDLDEAIAGLRAVVASGTNLQPALELALNRALLDPPNPEISARILRLLGLVAAIAAPSMWNAFQLELMAYPDRFVRSRAALLIGRSTKNVAWIGRRFLDHDPRVQASAVEALWAVDAAEARPLLLTAARSPNNRVAANAALGLYRISDLKSIALLLDMARQADESFRLSAFWAIGESKDPRFIPFLMEQFKTSQGKLRLAVTRAMACIRRNEKSAGLAGEIGIQVTEARASSDGARSIAFALRPSGPLNVSEMKPTEFALWESGTLVEDYDLKLPNANATLAAGFVAPNFPAPDDPYALAVAAALMRSCASKRPDDVWRIDRYFIEPRPVNDDAPRETTLPYDESLLTQEVKARYCFISAPDLLSRAVSSEVPAERTAADSYRAMERQCVAMRRLSGKRHVFLFLHHESLAALEEPTHVRILSEIAAQEKIVFHGFAPGPSHDSAVFRDMCLSTPGGTFSDATPDQLPAVLEDLYATLLNGCEISYRLTDGAKAGPVLLKVSSALGSGQADIALRPAGAPAASVSATAEE